VRRGQAGLGWVLLVCRKGAQEMQSTRQEEVKLGGRPNTETSPPQRLVSRSRSVRSTGRTVTQITN
jgi:hypothetical protein